MNRDGLGQRLSTAVGCGDAARTPVWSSRTEAHRLGVTWTGVPRTSSRRWRPATWCRGSPERPVTGCCLPPGPGTRTEPPMSCGAGRVPAARSVRLLDDEYHYVDEVSLGGRTVRAGHGGIRRSAGRLGAWRKPAGASSRQSSTRTPSTSTPFWSPSASGSAPTRTRAYAVGCRTPVCNWTSSVLCWGRPRTPTPLHATRQPNSSRPRRTARPPSRMPWRPLPARKTSGHGWKRPTVSPRATIPAPRRRSNVSGTWARVTNMTTAPGRCGRGSGTGRSRVPHDLRSGRRGRQGGACHEFGYGAALGRVRRLMKGQAAAGEPVHEHSDPFEADPRRQRAATPRPWRTVRGGRTWGSGTPLSAAGAGPCAWLPRRFPAPTRLRSIARIRASGRPRPRQSRRPGRPFRSGYT